MAKLVPVSGTEAVRKLAKDGWEVSRQKGSHVMMVKDDYRWTISVPQHRELGPGLLRSLIRQAGLSVSEFNEL